MYTDGTLVSCKFTVNGKYFDGNASSKNVHIFLANLKLTLPGIYYFCKWKKLKVFHYFTSQKD